MKWSLSGAEVVGGNRPLDAKVPFAHARVVLQKQITEEGEGEEYLLVYRYPSPEEAEGDTMMRDEWEALIAAGEAHRLPTPLPAKRNGTLWILGAAFPKREQVVKELSDANALIESVEVTGDLLVCYVQEDSASIVRERQAKSATFHAWSATAKGKWDEAVSHAERALAIGGMSPERVAQLAFLYERQGRVSRSRGYLRMALDSRGQSFHEKTLEKFNSYSDRANPKGKVVVSSASEEQLAKKEFDRAWQLARHQEWDKALPHALRALEIDDMSPKHFALVMLLYEHERDEEQKNHYRRMAQEWRGPKFVEEMLKKHRDFSTLSERSEDSKTSFQPAYLIIFVALFLLTLPIILGGWAFPSKPEVSEIAENLDVNGLGVLLRKLSATILVYFMQFGFIAFEAGYVQQNFRKQSAIKNLIVFAISFISYIFLGWHIQRWIHPDAFSNLLDIAFNAGFASTVALIIANTITERGTLLVNTLCSMVAAGIAYPVLAGLLFPSEGLITTGWGFVDTAGGCVVHVLGGAFGLTAALWIGPRIKRRAWYILGKVQVEQRGDYIPFAVIGAFFLWFGWLGFNSGNATDWNRFLDAFRNTNIGASAGGLVGLIIAVANGAMLATRGSSDLTSGGLAREIRRDIANLERVVLGMMGGLVAVTANAVVVKPWEALFEAILGASVAIVGSAWLLHFRKRLDDPLGAIATHGLAGIVGVICTAFFYHPQGLLKQLVVQAGGIGLAALVGGALATILCSILWYAEHHRPERLWLYGKLLRLTPPEQYTGRTGTEGWLPAESIKRALVRIRTVPPTLQNGEDEDWTSAIAVLALSDNPDREIEEALSKALDDLLNESYQGRPEEWKAIAAIRARADISKLPMCVNRALEHRRSDRSPGVLEWNRLDADYRETLIVTIRDLAEGFAATYRIRRVEDSPTKLEDMIIGFSHACDVLQEIGEDRILQETGEDRDTNEKLRRRAEKEFLYLKRLPWYSEIIKAYEKINPHPQPVIPKAAAADRVHDIGGVAP